MLNRLERLAQRVGGSNELIDQWLHARKELLVAYCTVIGLKPQKEKHTPLNEKALENFYDNLVDYLSSGHFHHYDKIINQTAGAPSPKATITDKIYPALSTNTEAIMAFHYRYANTKIDQDICYEFQQALSDVGEALNTRFDLEDKLINWAMESSALITPPTTNNSDSANPA